MRTFSEFSVCGASYEPLCMKGKSVIFVYAIKSFALCFLYQTPISIRRGSKSIHIDFVGFRFFPLHPLKKSFSPRPCSRCIWVHSHPSSWRHFVSIEGVSRSPVEVWKSRGRLPETLHFLWVTKGSVTYSASSRDTDASRSIAVPVPLLSLCFHVHTNKRKLAHFGLYSGNSSSIVIGCSLLFTPPSLVGNKTDMPMASIREWFPGLVGLRSSGVKRNDSRLILYPGPFQVSFTSSSQTSNRLVSLIYNGLVARIERKVWAWIEINGILRG